MNTSALVRHDGEAITPIYHDIGFANNCAAWMGIVALLLALIALVNHVFKDLAIEPKFMVPCKAVKPLSKGAADEKREAFADPSLLGAHDLEGFMAARERRPLAMVSKATRHAIVRTDSVRRKARTFSRMSKAATCRVRTLKRRSPE